LIQFQPVDDKPPLCKNVEFFPDQFLYKHVSSR